MNEELKSFVEGNPGNIPIKVVNDTGEYHSFPINRQVEQVGMDKVYQPDGCAMYLATYGHPLPGVFYLNYDVASENTYNRILEKARTEFGEQIREHGVTTVSWDDLSRIYLQGLKERRVSSEELRLDVEGIYESAINAGEILVHNFGSSDIRKKQTWIDSLLKDSELNLMAVRPQDLLFTYAMDKFNPRLTDEGEIVFDIYEKDLTQNMGGIYNKPGTAIHFDNYRTARDRIYDKAQEIAEAQCLKLKGQNPKELEIMIPYVVVLDEVVNPLALKELQIEREPISRILSPEFRDYYNLDGQINEIVSKHFDGSIPIKWGLHIFYDGISELETHQKSLESLGVSFWDDFNTNPKSEYREKLERFVDEGLVFVLQDDKLTPIGETNYRYDSATMLHKDNIPEIPVSAAQTANA